MTQSKRFSRIKMLLAALLLVSVLFCVPGFPQSGNLTEPETKPVEKGSLAWQMEEFTRWLMQTRKLVPSTSNKPEPFYTLEELSLSGSVMQNKYTFTLKGSVVSDEIMFVPLFGAPHQVLLKNITINNEPAIVGFNESDYYYVGTKQKSFIIRGEMSLRNELSFSIPGPVNYFSASLSDGRVVEGNILPGLTNTVIHLESGKKQESSEINLPPLFQVSRAVRIQKEITFEYQVKVRSGSEISSVTLPIRYSEIVLDIPGITGWKITNGELTVPVSGKDVQFSIVGRLPKLVPFETDPRSTYEFWLVESDMEHRVRVKTTGKQIDSGESPIAKQLTSPKLFLLTKGQQIEMDVRSLSSIEALAVVISNQSRRIVWTKEGTLVAEDTLTYQNNGLDYLPFNCSGKPGYFEIDTISQKILSENPENKSQILIPLKKGEHSSRIQSTSHVKHGFLGGILKIPVPNHDLTISNASVVVGLPSGIIPIWFTGGGGINSPLDWLDIICLLIALGLSFLFFKEKKHRVACFIAIAGIYYLIPVIYYLCVIGMIFIGVVRLIILYIKGWKRWAIFAVIGFIFFVLLYIAYYSPGRYYDIVGSKSVPTYQEYLSAKQDKSMAMESPKAAPQESDESQMGQREFSSQQMNIPGSIGNTTYTGKEMVEGVIPVAIPMPFAEHNVYIHRQIVTREHPLTPTLFYITDTLLYPVYLFWFLCVVYIGLAVSPKIKPLVEIAKNSWQKPSDDKKDVNERNE